MDARTEQNEHGQAIGFPLTDWSPPPFPPHQPMAGHHCVLEPLNPERHARELHTALSTDAAGTIWTYLPYGPFSDFAMFRDWLANTCSLGDPQFYAIRMTATSRVAGLCSYLRIDPGNGSIEVGHLNYSPALQRTPAATEAMYLMMKNVFDLGYRRYEWKCDSLNAPSCAAARRLGFTFEGVFRQSIVYKRRNRDTAWFSAVDREWPSLKRRFEGWLAPENFDEQGRQRRPLREFTSAGNEDASRK